ncbi:holin [Gordonia phage Outis]|nr:holin [Gordonia phage StarStruck]WGH22058.1 holin [Gordonia phage MerCougar]WKW85024.1 holin [Gordonia phage Outis]
MTLPSVPPVPANELIVQLREDLHRQPWFKRFSNTVTSAVGVLALVVWFLVTNGVEIPVQYQTIGGAVLAVLVVLGVLQTPNGITPKGIAKVERAAEEASAKF